MDATSEQVTCPLCGGEAERGAVYSRSALTWRSGKVDWKNKLKAEYFFGLGKALGEVGVFWASSAPGIYCHACQRVILDKTDQPAMRDYFPDVHK